tara:strand:+ start:497 stop:808 length:312 start_codon:yes stop_codon:yes gene_type:complete
MNWTEDDLVWSNLDDLMMNSWNDLKQFLDALHEHSEELNPQINAMLFGGMGQLVQGYVVARTELNSPKHSLAIALEKVAANPAFAALMHQTVNSVVDRAMTGE